MAFPAPTPAADLWSVDDLVDFFAPTTFPVSRSELQRWIARYDVPVTRAGRRNLYALDDVLPVHRDEVAARLQRRSCSSR